MIVVVPMLIQVLSNPLTSRSGNLDTATLDQQHFVPTDALDQSDRDIDSRLLA